MKPHYSHTPGAGGRTVQDVANHYLSIGFTAPERMAVVELLRRTIAEGSSEPLLDGGRFIRLHDHASGARVNVVVDHAGTVRSAKPSFFTPLPQRVRVRITGLHPDEGNPDADLVQVAPVEGTYPLAVEFEEGSRAIAALPFGEEADVEIVGFADTMECYPHADAYEASGIPLGIREVLPAGLVPLPTPQGVARPRAAALISGIVLECNRLHNELGGADFLHLVIETAGMVFDAVVSPDAIEGPPPQPGRIVTGSLWFVARQPQEVAVGASISARSEAIDSPQEHVDTYADTFVADRPARTRLFGRWS